MSLKRVAATAAMTAGAAAWMYAMWLLWGWFIRLHCGC